ncbi:hypothetical protein OHS33_34480 [Streptomyces sp. NBC_00536]|uniref:hypothetical protein n=1 Tax=Streptomyces sp. NBC_00536 TaxID=2975769 RepID=UPI002E7FBA47|nr:hypothetical protein [Streptomyces sp. NBC_00536]WUC83027.1 hypothetical protein OHS33_34480 [Streptomyces sp. NBC_00536]
MSEVFPPSEPSESSEQPVQSEQAVQSLQSEGVPEAGGRTRRGMGRLVPRRRGARWAAVGAAVVLVGGGAAAAAVVERHHEHEGKLSVSRADSDHENGQNGEHGENGDGRGPGGHGGKDGRRGGKPGEMQQRGERGYGAGAGAWNGKGLKAAPAPLPALPLSQAADKAAAAVTGGKVESLRVVGQDGGGSAWLAVVIGPDGVRHSVTVSGADGTVTGNTVMGAAQ